MTRVILTVTLALDQQTCNVKAARKILFTLNEGVFHIVRLDTVSTKPGPSVYRVHVVVTRVQKRRPSVTIVPWVGA